MLIFIYGLLSLLVIGLILFNVGPLRRALFTKPIMAWFKSVQPPMSSTEREAIDAGDTWHEAQLFQGKPQWSKLLANLEPKLTKAESDFLANQTEELCLMLDDWKITHQDLDLPANVWNFLKTSGFLGLHIPPAYGGKGFTTLASSTVVQKITTKSPTAAVTVMVPNSLGPAELLLNYGTTAQKDKYLHNLAKGVEVPCFGLTSTVAGSDASSIIDEGIVTRGDFEGQKDILGLRLNWSKRYITLAPVATLIGLAVKVRDPDHLLSSETERGITVVLMPTNLPGIKIGRRHYPLHQAFMNGPTQGENVFVPLDHIIGGPERIGKGWQMLVECLAAGRGVSLPAVSAATVKHCFRTTGAYAKLRRQFGLSIGKFEGVSNVMARIAGYTYIVEATRLLTLGAIDNKYKPSVITAICKYHMTELARRVINDAMDIHGGRGIISGPKNYLVAAYDATPVGITVEGANILTRCLMIYGQGAIRCHPYVLKEMFAATNPDTKQGLLDFDTAFCGHFWYTVANFVKLKWHSLTGMIFCEAPDIDPTWSKYYKSLSFFSIALACCSDVAMLFLGGNLKRKENLSARLGDVLSYLYMASAVLKYNHDNGNTTEDQPFVRWTLDYCLYNIQASLEYFLLNFPVRWIAKPLQWIIFLVWRNYRLPSDALSLQLSNFMMKPSAFRERLTSNCMPVVALEEAWMKMFEAEPTLAKIEQAVKSGNINKSLTSDQKIAHALAANIITAQEATMLREFEAMQLSVLQVDDFSKAELTGNKA
jgi:alkylation response protein AidB-like acyl-CoA dehydrogenase